MEQLAYSQTQKFQVAEVLLSLIYLHIYPIE